MIACLNFREIIHFPHFHNHYGWIPQKDWTAFTMIRSVIFEKEGKISQTNEGEIPYPPLDSGV